jgi:hypothetical protein
MKVLFGHCDTPPLLHFAATFIKWRYETLALAVQCLLTLEEVCRHMQDFHFTEVQDKEGMKTAMQAAHDPALWNWLKGPGKHVVLRIESARHWFMVCGCPEHRRQRHETGKQDPCNRVGRRLHEAADFVTKQPGLIRKAATDLKPVDTCDDNSICTDTKSMLRKYASLFETRTKYFMLIPWMYVNMDTEEGAQACLRQFADADFDSLDPLSQRLGTTLEADMQVVAFGGAPSAAIMKEVRRLENASCDESPGEGYHREATHSAGRSRSATTQTIIQEIRLERGLSRVKASVAEHGQSARDIIRWEWRNFKRILQHDPKRAHRGVGDSAQQVYDRIYRQDERSRHNWTLIVDPPRADAPFPFEDNVDAVQREYIREVIVPGQYYEIERRGAPPVVATSDAIVDAGLEPGAVRPSARRIFQVMEKHYGHKRPKLMPTLVSYKDPALHAKIAVLVQPFEVREMSDNGGIVSCFPKGEPTWIDHCELGSFEDIVYRMFQFRSVDIDEEDHECFVLTDRHIARPTIPITDESCPVLMILWHLERAGWRCNNKTYVHTRENMNVRICESRDTMRHKLYYMVLCRLEDRLRQSSCIPSNQVQLYYRLLLQGKHVEPYLPLASYIQLLGGASKLLPLPAPEAGLEGPLPPPEPPDTDDEVFVAVDDGEPAPKRKYTPPSTNPLPHVDDGPQRAPPRRRAPPAPVPDPIIGDPPGDGRPGSSGDGIGGGGGGAPFGPRPPIVDGSDDDVLVAVVDDPEALCVAEPEVEARDARVVEATGGGQSRWEMYTKPKGGEVPELQA